MPNSGRPLRRRKLNAVLWYLDIFVTSRWILVVIYLVCVGPELLRAMVVILVLRLTI